MTGEREDRGDIAKLIGIAAVASSALYFISDLIELIHGGFSTLQLGLTYAAEAAIPLFVLGLFAEQRPKIGRLGLIGALVSALGGMALLGYLFAVEAAYSWGQLARMSLFSSLAFWLLGLAILVAAWRSGPETAQEPTR